MPGFFYEHFEELKPTVIAGTDQFLGVELHGYEVVAFVSLDDAVCAVGSYLQTRSHGFDSLVMRRIDFNGVGTVEFCQQTARLSKNLVHSATVPHIFGFLLCKILIQGTAEHDIHQLLAAAYSEDGLF